MEKNRLESFSDGVLAIIITIMVLELGVPQGHDLSDLYPLIPIFLGYILSFIYVGIYWNNHHHLLKTANKISGTTLWINLILLFWLSLFPFTTAWMAESNFSTWPTAFYGIVLLMAAVFYFVLQYHIISIEGEESTLKIAIGNNLKGKVSLILYILAIVFALIIPPIAQGIFVLVALIWLIPDKRIENLLD
jgi:uncharacterized membrane protein